ncbi:MAG: thioredoxin family protein [Lentisphaerae bacterium]|nr:thioredoxin family protein [Lentisphaerota bacterium]
MKAKIGLMVVCLTAGLISGLRAEDAVIGKPAPDFSLLDTQGKTNSLSAFKHKTVVLEWTNFDCPFVKKHYGAGNMQKLQKFYTERGVVWLTVNSSSPRKQGHYPPEKWNAMLKEKGAAATALLLDPEGRVGKAYGAKTTPHFFVIDPEGVLIYQGAIDDKPTTALEDVATAKNYVQLALDAAMAGKPVETPSTQSYGCSIKY